MWHSRRNHGSGRRDWGGAELLCVCILFMCVCTTSGAMFGVTSSGAHVSTAKRVSDGSAWNSHVTLSQELGSVVLVLLTPVGQRAYEPCTEFGGLCCLGLQLRAHTWGGDVDVLDAIQAACEADVVDPWETAMAQLATRVETNVHFTLDDVRDPWRARYTTDNQYDLGLLLLVVKKWKCDQVSGEDLCLVRLQALEQVVRVDIADAQAVSVVSVPVQCTSDKPENALWAPSSTSQGYASTVATCKWFCAPGFQVCPGSLSDSPAVCFALPNVGAILRVSVAFMATDVKHLEPFKDGSALDNISTVVATRMTTAGVVGVDECSVIVRRGNHVSGTEVGVGGSSNVGVSGTEVGVGSSNVRDVSVRVDLPIVNERIRGVDMFYDGAVLHAASSVDMKREAIEIPQELPSADDRMLPDFFDFTVVLYSNDTSVSLAEQAMMLRYVLFNALDELDSVAKVLYMSDVHGVMRQRADAAVFSISDIDIVALSLWAFVLLVLSLSALLCPFRCSTCVGVECTYCTQHSHRHRVLIVVLMLLIVGAMASTGLFSNILDIDLVALSSFWEFVFLVLSVSALICLCWCGTCVDVECTCCTQHSPRDRVLIVVLMLLIVGAMASTGVFYVTVVVPRVESADILERPMLMLAWLWYMLVACMLAVMLCCLVAARVRRCI